MVALVVAAERNVRLVTCMVRPPLGSRPSFHGVRLPAHQRRLLQNRGVHAAPRPSAPQHQRDLVAHPRSEEHTSELQSLAYLVCRLLLEKKKKTLHSAR